jgi:hypothetical protein
VDFSDTHSIPTTAFDLEPHELSPSPPPPQPSHENGFMDIFEEIHLPKETNENIQICLQYTTNNDNDNENDFSAMPSLEMTNFMQMMAGSMMFGVTSISDYHHPIRVNEQCIEEIEENKNKNELLQYDHDGIEDLVDLIEINKEEEDEEEEENKEIQKEEIIMIQQTDDEIITLLNDEVDDSGCEYSDGEYSEDEEEEDHEFQDSSINDDNFQKIVIPTNIMEEEIPIVRDPSPNKFFQNKIEEYKKMGLRALKTLVTTRGLCNDPSRLKKQELI